MAFYNRQVNYLRAIRDDKPITFQNLSTRIQFYDFVYYTVFIIIGLVGCMLVTRYQLFKNRDGATWMVRERCKIYIMTILFPSHTSLTTGIKANDYR